MGDSDLLAIFWEEANEHLTTLNDVLLKLEMAEATEADSQHLLKELNRVAHSLKGAARAVGLTRIETVAHYMEEVFQAVMNQTLMLSPTIADTIYDGIDLIQTIADGADPQPDVLTRVITKLEQAIVRGVAPAPPQVTTRPPDADDVPADGPPEPGRGDESVRVTVARLDRLMAQITELSVSRMHDAEQLKRIHRLRATLNDWQKDWRDVRTAYIRLARRMQDMPDDLLTLLNFLEHNQRQLSQTNRMVSALQHDVAQENLRMNSLVDQIEDEVDRMRLVPFTSLIALLQRMVRDLARDLEKSVYLEVTGGDVAVDKAVLDELLDPMMHILRNAVDHGIEAAEDRRTQGKPATGKIQIQIEQRGGEIIIQVRDDGRGIDADAVRRSAVKRGLIDPATAAALSDEDVRTYIFYTGLTTSEQVTTVSGRGLGMDIVRDRVEGLRGRVSVSSVVGQGTTLTLNVPVSLTRIRCVVLKLGTARYAVPSSTVVRLADVAPDDVFTAEGQKVIALDDEVIPLVELAQVLDVPANATDADLHPLVVLQATDRIVGFQIDGLETELELILKPFGPEIAGARYLSGAALMGAGDVIVVLDVNDLVRGATGMTRPPRREVQTAPIAGRLRVLVVDDSITTRTLEKNILETAGFQVTTAVDGVEGFSRLSEEWFDLVITDVEMPQMDGLELCRRIKADEALRTLPVILLTSLSKPEQREAGLKAGADAYLVKSNFDQDELLETIQAVVG